MALYFFHLTLNGIFCVKNWLTGHLLIRYVKVYLLPDRSKAGKRKTKVKKHTLNPLFEEILKVQDFFLLRCKNSDVECIFFLYFLVIFESALR
jgi:hypothetical protein